MKLSGFNPLVSEPLPPVVSLPTPITVLKAPAEDLDMLLLDIETSASSQKKPVPPVAIKKSLTPSWISKIPSTISQDVAKKRTIQSIATPLPKKSKLNISSDATDLDDAPTVLKQAVVSQMYLTGIDSSKGEKSFEIRRQRSRGDY